MLKDTPYTLDSVVRMLLGAAFLVGLVWMLGYLSGVLIPFVVALLLAYLLNPLTSRVERAVRNRWLAVAITVIGLAACATGVVWLISPLVAAEFAHMGRVLADLAGNAALARRAREYLPDDVWVWLRTLAGDEDVRALFTGDGAMDALRRLAGTILPGVRGVLFRTLDLFAWVLGLGVVLLYVIFLLADYGRIRQRWQEYLPERYRAGAVAFMNEFERTMSLYFRGQLIIALLVGALLSAGFVIIGLPMAVMLGMFIGILNIAPYLGTLGIAPAVLLAGLSSLEAGQPPWIGIVMVLIVFAVVQAIQEIILIPRIQGENLGLSPWLILLSLSIWGKLLGFLGLLIALPTTCLCLSYYRRMLAGRRPLDDAKGKPDEAPADTE
ncbi:AI-2E family transporter [Pseudodesulfovibrio pelocollis]|uniref:AI-2E family transporter n=1 Tax=Pseudodesulfovibrio pelocollis TaxID=3051432 RepID=UPI00255AF1EC|nr:AI-2E family transporter [Pseudodesulfovibrio sp. SB368]